MYKDPSSFESETDHKQLITSLQTIYQQDEQRLDRIWQRLSQHIVSNNSVEALLTKNHLDNNVNYLEQQEISELPKSHTQRRYNWLKLIAGLAATLIIISALFVYNIFGNLPQPLRSSNNIPPRSGIYLSHDGILKLNPKDGHILWHYAISDISLYDTLAVIGEANNQVYMVTRTQELHAINAKTGKLVWKKLLDPSQQPSYTYIQIAKYSVVTEAAIYIPMNNTILKLNHANGNMIHIYRVGTVEDAKKEPGLFATFHNNTFYVSWKNTLYAFDTNRNIKKWQKTIKDTDTLSKPLIENDQVYVASYSETSSKESSYLYAFNASNGTSAWVSHKIPNQFYIMSLSAQNKLIYIMDPMQTIFAYNAKDGTLAWSKKLRVPSIMGGISVEPNEKQPDLPKSIVPLMILPSVDNKLIYINGLTIRQEESSSELIAIDALTGTEQWSFSLDIMPRIPTIIQDNIAYVQAHNTLYALDTNGKQLWHVQLPTINN